MLSFTYGRARVHWQGEPAHLLSKNFLALDQTDIDLGDWVSIQSIPGELPLSCHVQKTGGYCWSSYFHTIRLLLLRWIPAIFGPSTKAGTRH